MKKIFKIAMAGIVICSGMAMFACGESAPDKNSFEKMDALVQQMKENSSNDAENKKMFTSGNVYNLESDYILSSFNLMEDESYQALFALPMNYISSHYQVLKDIEAKKDLTNDDKNAINALKTNIDAMQTEYNKLSLQYERLKTFANTAGHEIIYQGELQEFRYKTTDIVGATYKVAISLANVEEEVLDFYSGKINKSSLTVQDTVEMRDYLSLYVGQDYYTLILKNCKSSNLSESVAMINSIKVDFKNFVKEVCAPSELKSLSSSSVGGSAIAYNSKIDNLLEVNELLKNDRQIMLKATSEFSFYDFMLSYNGENFDIESVKDLHNFQDLHVSAIEDYFKTTLKYYTNYIKSIIV